MELPRQCAWCRRTFTSTTIDEPPRADLLDEVSHGRCPMCRARQFDRLADEAAARGDTLRALDSRRQGLAALATYAQRRAAATRATSGDVVRSSGEVQDRARALCARMRAK